jgi:hypothetical protein
MRCNVSIFVSSAVLTVSLAGCQSHQVKVDALQKEYDAAELQFRKDCSAELFNVPPTLSPKCSQEDAAAKEKLSRLKAEQAKQ